MKNHTRLNLILLIIALLNTILLVMSYNQTRHALMFVESIDQVNIPLYERFVK